MPRTYACIMVGHTQLCLPLNSDTMSAMMEQKQHFRRSRRCYFLSTFLPFLHGPGHNCVLFVSSISYTQPPDKKVLSARCHKNITLLLLIEIISWFSKRWCMRPSPDDRSDRGCRFGPAGDEEDDDDECDGKGTLYASPLPSQHSPAPSAPSHASLRTRRFMARMRESTCITT